MVDVVIADLMSAHLVNPVRDRFLVYSREIDAKNYRHERLVKASRDVTMESKRLIYALHRLSPITIGDIRTDKLNDAHESMKKIQQIIATKVIPELRVDNYLRHHRAYSPGLQEYVEARTLLSYCDGEPLISPEQVDDEIREVYKSLNNGKNYDFVLIEATDYTLGVADLSGELMRKAIATQSQQTAVNILAWLSDIQQGMSMLYVKKFSIGRDMNSKMKTLRHSVEKVQRSCFNRAVRLAEHSHRETKPFGVKREYDGGEMERDDRQHKKLKTAVM